MSFRLATWPPSTQLSRNPYLAAFYRAVESYGVQPVMGVEPTRRWVQSHGAAVDGIHIHWPDGLWRRQPKTLPARVAGASEFFRFLRAARRAHVRIVWTVHNLARHSGADWLDQLCYRALVAHADLIICHSRWCADVVTAKYAPRGTVVVMPHGNYDGFYPAPRARDAVLTELGLRPDLPVVSALGNLRGNKGLSLAARAVRSLHGVVQFVIGGQPHRQDAVVEIEAAVSASGGRFLGRELTAQEFADLTAASEAILLPYQNITTSGSLLNAWTMKRGVIASDLPYFREMMAPEPFAAQLFDLGDARHFADAIVSYLKVPSEQRNHAARSLADRYAWDRCVPPAADVFMSWQARGVKSTVQ